MPSVQPAVDGMGHVQLKEPLEIINLIKVEHNTNCCGIAQGG